MLTHFPFIIQLIDVLFTSEGSQVNDELVLSEESEDEEVSNYFVFVSFFPRRIILYTDKGLYCEIHYCYCTWRNNSLEKRHLL